MIRTAENNFRLPGRKNIIAPVPHSIGRKPAAVIVNRKLWIFHFGRNQVPYGVRSGCCWGYGNFPVLCFVFYICRKNIGLRQGKAFFRCKASFHQRYRAAVYGLSAFKSSGIFSINRLNCLVKSNGINVKFRPAACAAFLYRNGGQSSRRKAVSIF